MWNNRHYAYWHAESFLLQATGNGLAATGDFHFRDLEKGHLRSKVIVHYEFLQSGSYVSHCP